MNYSFYQVDVFTNIPFGGNPLAVVFNSEGLTDQNMQNIAMEMNLSETSFVLPPDHLPADFLIRIFTPQKELPFAGHPVLGTAHVLRESGKVLSGDHQIKLATKAGIINIREKQKKNILFMDQLLPEFQNPIYCSDELGKILGISTNDINLTNRPIQIVSTGLPVLLVPIASINVLKNISIDNNRLIQFLANIGTDLLCVFTDQTLDSDSTIHSRVFAPSLGIVEDPATGSAAGAAGAYLFKNKLLLNDYNNMIIEQGHMVGRPSSLFVSIEQNKNKIQSIQVGGESLTLIKGEITA